MSATFCQHRLFDCARRGLTLIEVTVTVLIIGFLAAVATPAFSGFLNQARVDSAAKRIKADLALARQTAVAESTTTSITFTLMSGNYSVTGVDHPDHPGQAYNVDLSLYPYNSTIVMGLFGIDLTAQFDRFGQPQDGGSLQLQSGSAIQTVTLNADTGEASVP